mmetsp:Transcript_5566/g.18500  ORF Transcript_5566/g.18500 Transcript_5566/m.18500 type:complete len:244 (-) Transcript_5566:1497-2228(-)
MGVAGDRQQGARGVHEDAAHGIVGRPEMPHRCAGSAVVELGGPAEGSDEETPAVGVERAAADALVEARLAHGGAGGGGDDRHDPVLPDLAGDGQVRPVFRECHHPSRHALRKLQRLGSMRHLGRAGPTPPHREQLDARGHPDREQRSVPRDGQRGCLRLKDQRAQQLPSGRRVELQRRRFPAHCEELAARADAHGGYLCTVRQPGRPFDEAEQVAPRIEDELEDGHRLGLPRHEDECFLRRER